MPLCNGYETLLDSDRESRWKKLLRVLWSNALLITTIISICLAIPVGVLVSLYTQPDRVAILLVSLPGEVFLNMLKMIIVPLIMLSVMAGVGSLDFKSSFALLWRTLLYYMSTTFSAVLLGIALVVLIAPGLRQEGRPVCQQLASGESLVAECANLTVVDSIADLLRNMFPANILSATIFQAHTTCSLQPKPVSCECQVVDNSSVANHSSCATAEVVTGEQLVFSVEAIMSPDILGLIVFSAVLGLVLSSMGEEGRGIIKGVNTLNEAVLKMVHIIMIYSPVGIFFLVVGELAKISDLSTTFAQLGVYMATVVTGLVLHSCVLLPLLYLLVARKNPLKLLYGCSEAMLTAVSTSSSSASLPVTLRCLETKMSLDKRVTRFMIPLGATFNMDGTALYEAVAAIFIAQLTFGAQPNFGQIILISITATLAAIGAAGIPQAGLITMVIVLTSVGLPTSRIAILLVVDWFLDRLRTVVNVFGDCVGCGIVCRYSNRFLPTPVEEGGSTGGESGTDTPIVTDSAVYQSDAVSENGNLMAEVKSSSESIPSKSGLEEQAESLM